jgi:hypothetical protein
MTERTFRLTVLLLAALAGCGGRGEPGPGNPPSTNATPVADSLVLVAPGGFTVWLTEGRPATDLKGVACLERTLEIRTDSARRKVPLLYTSTTPTLLDDTTMRAELSRDCRPAAAYRVSLRDGMPHRLPQ